jgi:hypothetical protein
MLCSFCWLIKFLQLNSTHCARYEVYEHFFSTWHDMGVAGVIWENWNFMNF